MAVLTVRTVTAAGYETVALTACAALGDSFLNDGKVLIEINNAAGGSQDIIFVLPRSCDQGEAHTVTIPVGAGKRKVIGFLAPRLYNQTTGYANITYSAVVTLTIGVYHIA